MKTNLSHTVKMMAATVALSMTAMACGESESTQPPLTADGYAQIEQLARPGINEALLISKDFLAGYNATAPTFSGVPEDVLNAVVGEAKTVLKALYLGTCLLNGAAGLTPETGFHPAGIECHAVGPALWWENSLAGVRLTDASQAAAQAYADKVFAQFIPDTLRIDMTVESGYLTLCGDANSAPLLCGGRKLNEDVIDITLNYLLAGAAVGPDAPAQFRALVSDGVQFSTDPAQNAGSLFNPDLGNSNQHHASISNTFPYSAAPL
jgi:hypothetical protein